MSSSKSTDAFLPVVGRERGLIDPREIRRELASAERQLASTLARLTDAEHNAQALDRELLVLKAELDDAQGNLKLAGLKFDECAFDRDLSAYTAMRAGRRDPVSASRDEHHGLWTPGRPYLTGQHAWSPTTGKCFRARPGGVPARKRPGESRKWRRCRDGDCPSPAVVPVEPHPVSSGHALRQSAWWWDRNNRRLALDQLPPEHLLAIIDHLRQMAATTYVSEVDYARYYVPCPVNAYASAASWLADTPLMRALLAERRRRGLRHPRDDGAERWSDEQLF